MKKISVIIAAYNAEEYLSETMDSIFLQTMDNSEYEVIVINDGSSDNTLSILNSYKKNYSNLIIIDKENGGPSSARNAGLDIAQGEYVFFFDADDLLEPDALSTMYNTIFEKHSDLLIGKYDIFNRHTTIEIHNLDDLIELEEIDKYNTDILWTFSLSNKLFRRSIIEKHHLRLPSISYSEDGAFLTQFLYRCSKIVGLDYIIFHYRRYDDMDSITASISPSKIKDYITAHQMILHSAEESFLRDYPKYSSIDDAREQNPDIHNYLNTIIQKQLQIMLNQFYIQFWSLDSNTIQLLVDEINNKLKILDMKVIASANTSMFDGVSVPKHLTTLFAERGIEVVGNYSGSSSTGDLNLEKIAELKPDLIIMNIRHEKVHEQLAAIAPTVMIDDDISYVNWRGRFQQLGQWFDKEAAVEKWLADYDAKAAELAARIRDMIGDETFAVLEDNSVHFGSYYIYRSGGPGELVYDELKLTPSAGVPENVWGEVVDAEYFSLIDADHIFFFSDDGRAGDTGNLAVWKNMKAVKAGNVYFGINEDQYNMAFTAMGKELYLEKLANAILNHGDVE